MSIHLKFHCVIAWIESDSTDYFLKPLVNRTVFTLEQKNCPTLLSENIGQNIAHTKNMPTLCYIKTLKKRLRFINLVNPWMAITIRQVLVRKALT